MSNFPHRDWKRRVSRRCLLWLGHRRAAEWSFTIVAEMSVSLYAHISVLACAVVECSPARLCDSGVVRRHPLASPVFKDTLKASIRTPVCPPR